MSEAFVPEKIDFESVLERILASVRDVLQAKGLKLPALSSSTPLLKTDIGLDSLDLAGLLVELEYFSGIDPFSRGFQEFRTAGELARLYVQEKQ